MKVHEVALVLLTLLLIAGSVWSWVDGPCWLYTFSAGNEIPGRCLMP